ncbi:oligopeptide transporter, OPT family [candidate division KSB1 bacterium]|nr:oligopeptide transporter, OPT family [candidate division KSB1 bacterium]
MAEPTSGPGVAYKPFVPADTDMKELTFKALFLGVILAVILGAANAYLGLKAGMTVAATFPAAVISMAVLRLFKGTILEENMARTTGAVGEALAAGAIFTIPAFVMSGVWKEFKYIPSTLLMLVGGVLGVLFVIILRRALIEDATLPYPESKACAEIVKAGQGGSSGAKYVFGSMLLAGIIEFFKNPNGITVIKSYVQGIYFFGQKSLIRLLNGDTGKIFQVFDKNEKAIKDVAQCEQGYEGRLLLQSPNASPAFLGVGYIIGFKLAAITFAGGVFGWLFLMPIVLFLTSGSLADVVQVLGESSWTTVAKAGYNAIVKPIAVGGMLVGAFYTLFKMRNSLFSGIKRGLSDIREKQAGAKVSRVDKDLPFGMVIISIIVLVVCMIILYRYFSEGWGSATLAAIVMAIAGFMFAAVAGYLVGIIGSSSNPISGLTLTTLLIAALLMVLIGLKGDNGIAATLAVASVVCCVAGVAGDMMQDWKVGHILGGTPSRMQIGGGIGVIAASLVLVLPIMALHAANGIGTEELPAPQAGLMSMMSQGIISGEMAWPLVIAGMLFAVALIMINSPSPMLISVGMYLPFPTTFAIFIGGIIKFVADKFVAKEISKVKDKKIIEEKKSKSESTGLLIASGLVAGEALIGIILAILVVSKVKLNTLLNNGKEVAQAVIKETTEKGGEKVERVLKVVMEEGESIANYGPNAVKEMVFEANQGIAVLGYLVMIVLAIVLIYYPLKSIKNDK